MTTSRYAGGSSLFIEQGEGLIRRARNLLIVLPLLLLLATPALARPVGGPAFHYQAPRPTLAPLVSVPTNSVPQTYTVKSGDTLSAIGLLLGRTWMQVAGINKLANPDLILPGQVLTVPDSSYQPPATLAVASEGSSRGVTAAPAPSEAPPGVWGCIGHFESGNNPAENTGNGYYGEWQFAPGTWVHMMQEMGLGYRSYPYAAAAPESVQLQAAQLLQKQAGWGQWPVTSRKCGV